MKLDAVAELVDASAVWIMGCPITWTTVFPQDLHIGPKECST